MSAKTSMLIDLLIDHLEKTEQNVKPVAKQRAQQDLMQRLAGYRVQWEEGDDLEPKSVRRARENGYAQGRADQASSGQQAFAEWISQ